MLTHPFKLTRLAVFCARSGAFMIVLTHARCWLASGRPHQRRQRTLATLRLCPCHLFRPGTRERSRYQQRNIEQATTESERETGTRSQIRLVRTRAITFTCAQCGREVTEQRFPVIPPSITAILPVHERQTGEKRVCVSPHTADYTQMHARSNTSNELGEIITTEAELLRYVLAKHMKGAYDR